MKNEVKIALNICTFQREEFIHRNLSLLQASDFFNPDNPQYYGRLHIFVVDNGSSLQLPESPYVHCIYNRNTGGSGGFQRGIEEIRKRVDKKERVFVTTLTKKTAEKLTDYLRDIGINVQYLHSEIDAIERVEILRALRKGDFDVLVGINLLREGLDVPEVSLVAILDADKEGFLRSATSLIQTAG